jgi:hypothetical protein
MSIPDRQVGDTCGEGISTLVERLSNPVDANVVAWIEAAYKRAR